MTIVTNQTELRNALAVQEPMIVIANNFEISTIINIEYDVSISSSTDTIFTILKSASYFGNILRIRNGGSLTLKNIILDGNKENHPIENITNRALLIVAGGTLILQENAIIQNNITYLEGGGVYLSGDASYVNHFIMESNAIIRGCYARTNGGGIVAAIRNNEDTLIIRQQAVLENNNANYGGGLYYRIYTEGIKGSVILTGNPTFQNNIARNSGAAIAILNISNNTENLSFQLLDTPLLTNNTSANHGAGIYFVGTTPADRLDIGAAQIVQNQAGGYGGGIYTSGVLTSLNKTFIDQNQAGTGGGLYILTNNGGTLEIDSSTISYNRATNGASGSGGGIWINNRSTTLPFHFRVSNSSVSDNSASASGGGIYLAERANGLTVLMETVDFKKNQAMSNGAGMLLAAAGLSSVRILSSSIMDNTASNYGGGIYLSNENTGTATFLLSDSVISNNQAIVQGGGLRLSSGQGTVETTLEDCIIAENIAQTSSGGGIWCGGNNINLTLTKTTSINQNETIEGNGGGIYFNSQAGILRLNDDSKITNNLANRNTNITRNRGGAIYLVPGFLYMEGNSEIAFNKAKYGGGIGTGDGATVTIISGSIHNNKAILGGGIHNQASTIDFQGGILSYNQAQIGGGIYNQMIGSGNFDEEQEDARIE